LNIRPVPYTTLFRSYAGEMSDEIILDYQKVSGQNGWPALADFAPKSMGSEVNIAPTRELADRFPMEDGLPIDESPMYDDSPPEIDRKSTRLHSSHVS